MKLEKRGKAVGLILADFASRKIAGASPHKFNSRVTCTEIAVE